MEAEVVLKSRIGKTLFPDNKRWGLKFHTEDWDAENLDVEYRNDLESRKKLLHGLFFYFCPPYASDDRLIKVFRTLSACVPTLMASRFISNDDLEQHEKLEEAIRLLSILSKKRSGYTLHNAQAKHTFIRSADSKHPAFVEYINVLNYMTGEINSIKYNL